MENLRTIRLYGKLATRFGRVHRLAVSSTAEAVRALSALLPGFEKELMTSHQRGIRFACFVGKTNIGREELQLSGGSADIRIAPVLVGAKAGGVLQTIVGAALIVAGVMTGYAPLIYVGAAMALGGVIQMLSPQQVGLPKDSTKNPSYNFTGPVNTTAQGNCVPVLYGRMTVGSAVISAGISTESQAYVGAPLPGTPPRRVLDDMEAAL